MEKTIETPIETSKPIEKNINLVELSADVNKVASNRMQLIDLDINKGIITFKDANGKLKKVTTKDEVLFMNRNLAKYFEFGYPVIHVDVIETRFVDSYYDEDEDEYIENDEYDEYLEFRANINFYIKRENQGNHYTLTPYDFEKTTPFSKGGAQPQIYEAVPKNLISSYYQHFSSLPKERLHNNSSILVDSFVFINGKKYKSEEINVTDLDLGYLYVGYHTMNDTRNYCFNYQTKYSGIPANLEYHKTKYEIEPITSVINNQNDYYTFIVEKVAKNKTGILKIPSFFAPYSQRNHNSVKLDCSEITIDYKRKRTSAKTIFSTPAERSHADCCGAYQMYSHGNLVNSELPTFKAILTDEISALLYLFHLKGSKANRFSYLINHQLASSLFYYEKVFGKDNFKLVHSFTNINTGATISIYDIISYNRISKFCEFTLQNQRWRLQTFISDTSITGTELMIYQWFKNSELIVSKIKKRPTTKKKVVINKKPIMWDVKHTPKSFKSMRPHNTTKGRRIKT